MPAISRDAARRCSEPVPAAALPVREGGDNDIGAANTDNANNDIGRHRRIFAPQKSKKQLKMDDLQVYAVPVLLI